MDTPLQNNLIRTFPFYFNEYEVSLDIMPTSGKVSDWASIFHVTKGGNHGNIGDRMPAMWFLPGTRRLHICTALGTNPNYCVDGTSDIPAHVYTNINIQQKLLSNGSYQYNIRVNGSVRSQVINTNKIPPTLYNAKLYLGNPWNSSAKANVKNLVIKSEPTGNAMYFIVFYLFPILTLIKVFKYSFFFGGGGRSRISIY